MKVYDGNLCHTPDTCSCFVLCGSPCAHWDYLYSQSLCHMCYMSVGILQSVRRGDVQRDWLCLRMAFHKIGIDYRASVAMSSASKKANADSCYQWRLSEADNIPRSMDLKPHLTITHHVQHESWTYWDNTFIYHIYHYQLKYFSHTPAPLELAYRLQKRHILCHHMILID